MPYVVYREDGETLNEHIVAGPFDDVEDALDAKEKFEWEDSRNYLVEEKFTYYVGFVIGHK